MIYYCSKCNKVIDFTKIRASREYSTYQCPECKLRIPIQNKRIKTAYNFSFDFLTDINYSTFEELLISKFYPKIKNKKSSRKSNMIRLKEVRASKRYGT